MRLLSAQSSLRRAAGLMLAAGAFSAAVLLVVFDWSWPRMLGGAAIGTVLWGVFTYVGEVHHAVPGADALPLAPPDADIRTRRGLSPGILLVFPLCLVAAWLADLWDLGGVFVPGQLAGAAAANLVGAILVGRWQRAHGGEVVLRHNRDDRELYVARR